jgi:hypothetical protein
MCLLFFARWHRMLAMLHGNALKILSDGHIKHGQFIMIGVLDYEMGRFELIYTRIFPFLLD